MLQAGDSAPSFTARPIFGNSIAVPSGLASEPLVLCFLPILGSPYARRTLSTLQERFADFDRKGIQIAAIAPARLSDAQDFVPRYHLLFPLVADEDGHLGELYKLREDRYFLSTVRSALKGGASLKGMKFGIGWLRGPLRQLGAQFVLDKHGTIQYVNYPRSLTEDVNIEDLLACASSC